MRYLTIDGMLSGTGVRDSVEGGFISAKTLVLPAELAEKISKWVSRYEHAHYFEFRDKAEVAELDAEGLAICRMVLKELPDAKVQYYSSAEMKRILL